MPSARGGRPRPGPVRQRRDDRSRRPSRRSCSSAPSNRASRPTAAASLVLGRYGAVAKITMPRLGVSRIVIDTGSARQWPSAPRCCQFGKARRARHQRDRRPSRHPFPLPAGRATGDAILVEGWTASPPLPRHRHTGRALGSLRGLRGSLNPPAGADDLLSFGSRVHGPLRYVVYADADVAS